MKLKNKLFILLFVFIVLFLTLNINVFAAEGDFEKLENFQINNNLELNDIKEIFSSSYISLYNNYNYHYITLSEESVNFHCSNSIPYVISFDKEEYLYLEGPFILFIYNLKDKSISYINSHSNYPEGSGPRTSGLSEELIFSEFDVYNKDTGELVFQVPPQVEPTILAPIVEGAGAQKTLQEILKILPKILVVLVSYLGLRKALKMLSALLHRS